MSKVYSGGKEVPMPSTPTREIVEAMAEEYDPTWGYSDDSIGLKWAKRSYKAALRVGARQRRARERQA